MLREPQCQTPSLLEFISGQAEKLKAEREAGKKGGGATGDSLAQGPGSCCRGEEDKREEGKRLVRTAVVLHE